MIFGGNLPLPFPGNAFAHSYTQELDYESAGRQ
jgi:hypothetical protein